MIDPSSSDDDSDDDQREPLQTASHARPHVSHEPPSATSHDGPHRPVAGAASAVSHSAGHGHSHGHDRHDLGPSSSMGPSSTPGGPGGAGSQLRPSSHVPRPTSPSPSLASEKNIQDNIDPQVRQNTKNKIKISPQRVNSLPSHPC